MQVEACQRGCLLKIQIRTWTNTDCVSHAQYSTMCFAAYLFSLLCTLKHSLAWCGLSAQQWMQLYLIWKVELADAPFLCVSCFCCTNSLQSSCITVSFIFSSLLHFLQLYLIIVGCTLTKRELMLMYDGRWK